MKTLKSFLVILFALTTFLFGQEKVLESHKLDKIDCQTCHKCKYPTAKDPCLWPCARFELMSTYKFSDKYPDKVTIDRLENIYEPVVFSHGIHADMSNVSGGCIQCHHYSKDNEIHACSDCHERERLRDDVSIPDLKGAYHQQCMDCHREWSHSTECTSCHALKNTEGGFTKADTLYTKHEPLKTPKKIIYETDSEEGKLVTFFHDQHNKVFNFRCKDCHQNEVCVKCHDVTKKVQDVNAEHKLVDLGEKSMEESHSICSSCHKVEDKCAVCHNDKERKPFDHIVSTGWALKRYHENLKCQTCHGNKKMFKKLDSKCSSCHEYWSSDNFDHKVTGLILNEDHNELDCEDCHKESDFSNPPTCDDCHDEISFPSSKPGKVIKIKK